MIQIHEKKFSSGMEGEKRKTVFTFTEDGDAQGGKEAVRET